MSSFFVSSGCIDSIVGALRTPAYRNLIWQDKYLAEMKPFLSEGGYLDEDKFGRALLSLNVAALKARYGEKHGFDISLADSYIFSLPSVFSNLVTMNDGSGFVIASKALSCLIYQCSEGDVPKTKLYRLLEKILCRFEHHIVSSLPAYEAANWG